MILARLFVLAGAALCVSATALPTEYPFAAEVSQEAVVRYDIKTELAQLGNLTNLNATELLTRLDGAAKQYIQKNPDVLTRLKDAVIKTAAEAKTNQQFYSNLLHGAAGAFNVTLNDTHVQAVATKISEIIPTGVVESLLPQATSLVGALSTGSLGNINPTIDASAISSLLPQASNLVNQFFGNLNLAPTGTISAAQLAPGVETLHTNPSPTATTSALSETVVLEETATATDAAAPPVSTEELDSLMNDLASLAGSGDLSSLGFSF
eukprot:comp7357_c0_seq1/m.3053 comp7357_c0_seq1/g.3053  ORF comp7357_c0_seq1/g.3053 comp7357_c0_seq1/m.3053 type:complete len:266 (-) comp7357_c0_seq1:592-1389(-)